MFKRWKIKTITALLVMVQLVGLASALVALDPGTALAVGAEDLCAPAANGSGEPDGWLTAKFISRAEIKLTLDESKTGCRGGILQGRTNLSAIIGGNYFDSDLNDGDLDYRVPESSNPEAQYSRIDIRNDDFESAMDDPWGGHDGYVDPQQFASYVAGAEFTVVIREELFGSSWDCDDSPGSTINHQGASLSLVDNNPVWFCQVKASDDDIDDLTGYRIGSVLADALDSAAEQEKFNTMYTYAGTDEDGTITHVSPNQRSDRTFQWCQGEGQFINGENCDGDLYIDATPSSLARLGDGVGTFTLSDREDSDKSVETVVGGSGTDAAGSLEASGGGALGGDSVDCDGKGGPLGWIWCRIIEGSVGFINFVRTAILEPFLRVSPISTQNGTPQYEVWKTMRNLAYGLLIPVFLVVIISQALSLQLVDAYTIKKVLPRVAIATIGISLSIYVCAILIDFFNVLGQGIDDLVTAAVSGASGYDIEVDGLALSGLSLIGVLFGAGALSIWGLLGGATIGTAIALVALFVLLPVVLGVILVFVTLIARQALIVVMVILSPIALLAMVLPSTEKWFKAWLNIFIKLLLMYPLIVIFLVAGGLLAGIISGTNGLAGQIAAIFAIAIPLFFVPATFKFAGGALGAILTAATNMSGRIKGGIQGNPNNPNSLGRRLKDKAYHQRLQQRAQFVTDNKRKPSTFRPLGRYSGVRAWWRHGVYQVGSRMLPNADEAESMQVKAARERINDAQGNGKDGWIYALAFGDVHKDSMGRAINPVNGSVIEPNDLLLAKKEGDNQYLKQEAFAYAIRKAEGSDRQIGIHESYYLRNLGKEYADKLGIQWYGGTLSPEQIAGNFKGADFLNQGTNMDLKTRQWIDAKQFNDDGTRNENYGKYLGGRVNVKAFIGATKDRVKDYDTVGQQASFFEGAGDAWDQVQEGIQYKINQGVSLDAPDAELTELLSQRDDLQQMVNSWAAGATFSKYARAGADSAEEVAAIQEAERMANEDRQARGEERVEFRYGGTTAAKEAFFKLLQKTGHTDIQLPQQMQGPPAQREAANTPRPQPPFDLDDDYRKYL